MTPRNYVPATSAGSSEEARIPRLRQPDAVENQEESDRTDEDVLYKSMLLKPYFERSADLK